MNKRPPWVSKWKAPYEGAQRDPLYNKTAWIKLRQWQLKHYPLCAECLRMDKVTKATTVDHIIAIKDGGKKLCQDNLQSLCKKCHNRKTAKDVRRRKEREKL